MRKKIVFTILSVFIFLGAIFIVQAKEETLLDNTKELFKHIQLFADSITLISTDYVEPVKIKDLVYGAIRGMMDTLDGYSQFLDPEEFKEITEETKGQFGGIGIEIGIRDEVLTVIAPLDDSPAFRAGVRAGDKIVKINGEITRDMTLDEAVKKMRGEPGTEVSISVVRKDVEDIIDFKMVRSIIKLKSIKDVDIFEDNIGYIKIVEFQERTAKDLRKDINQLKAKGAMSLILDLRNNPGGLLNAAVESADIFLKQGELIVYTEGRSRGKRLEFKSRKRPEFEDMNIVVLIDEGSASAAEIFAGALKDNKRALTVGLPTFGKGSVQTVIPLQDKSALRLTTAAYFTPSGKNLRDKGIEPDVYVEKGSGEVNVSQEEKSGEKEKEKVFGMVKDEKTKFEKEAPKKKKHDNQVETAINILKGIKIFDTYTRAGRKG